MNVFSLRSWALGVSVLATGAALSARPASDDQQDLFPDGITVPAEPDEHSVEALAVGPSFEEQVLAMVNQQRLLNGGLPPLKGVGSLDLAAENHSFNMATRNFFAHCDPETGTNPPDRTTAAGYLSSFVGENIAAGYATPSAVMGGWMNSPGHRAAILRADFREIGVGYVNDPVDLANVREDRVRDCIPDFFNGGPFVHYWTQNFGTRNNVYPVVIEREAYETPNQVVALYVYGAGFAQEMRFRNEAGVFSPWEPYHPDKTWTLSSGAGIKQVFAEIRNGPTVLGASDTILLTAPGPAANFYTLTPCRLIDTRGPAGPRGGPILFAGSDRNFVVAGACGIPVTAVALSVNVAVTGATAPGNVSLHPGGTPPPVAATINYRAGSTRANNAVAPINAGQLAAYVNQPAGFVHLIVDVNGYFQ